MTDLPIPRYAIGQTVYHPTIDRTTEALPCPDCLGARKWRAVSPAGEEHETACPRCTDHHYARSGRDDLPALAVVRYVPRADRLTIGSITVKTHPYRGDDHVEYMTSTTGSGSIYRESHLYPNEMSALGAATIQATIKNAKVEATPQVTKSRAFSGLTYTDAAIAALNDNIFSSWQAFRSLTYAIESALPDDPKNDNDDQRAMREEIERYGKYGGTYLPIERHPIDALIEAFTVLMNDTEPCRFASAEGVKRAILNLKTIAGIADHPELPPCTCEFVSSPRDGCPRHGSRGSSI